MIDAGPRNTQENLKSVISGSITICALLAGFMLVFIGLILQNSKQPTWLELSCLFLATSLLEFFYRAMVKAWNLLAVRAMAETGDRILAGDLNDGPDYAAFRVLWAFQPKLYQGSWFILLLVALYGGTKSWLNVPAAVLGFLGGLLLYAVIGEQSWLRTWRRCRNWDKLVYLGQPVLAEDLPLHQRLFLKGLRLTGTRDKKMGPVSDRKPPQENNRVSND